MLDDVVATKTKSGCGNMIFLFNWRVLVIGIYGHDLDNAAPPRAY